MLQSSTIQFLKSLKKNNNKEWFDKNRQHYELAKTDFLSLVTNVLNEIQEPPVKDWPSLRFSFSIFNTKKEVDYLIEVFRDFIK